MIRLAVFFAPSIQAVLIACVVLAVLELWLFLKL